MLIAYFQTFQMISNHNYGILLWLISIIRLMILILLFVIINHQVLLYSFLSYIFFRFAIQKFSILKSLMLNILSLQQQIFSTIMAKKNHSLKNFKTPTQPKVSLFNAHANKIYQAKAKKTEKLQQTKQKVLARNKIASRFSNPKKINRFSLLDQQQDDLAGGLTHRGKSISQMKHFNDMEFGQQQQIDYFKQKQSDAQFQGFDNKPKSKNEVYKQIIEKSKQYKRQRQQQYEQNYQAAVELDEKFQEIIPKLQLITPSTKLNLQIQKRNNDYQKLLKQLQEEQRVIPQKNIVNQKKETQRSLKRKNQQLTKMLRQDSDEEDVRGWIERQQDSSEQQEEEDDEIDDVQLSSQQQQQGSEESSQGQDAKQDQIQQSVNSQQQQGDQEQQAQQSSQKNDRLQQYQNELNSEQQNSEQIEQQEFSRKNQSKRAKNIAKQNLMAKQRGNQQNRNFNNVEPKKSNLNRYGKKVKKC